MSALVMCGLNSYMTSTAGRVSFLTFCTPNFSEIRAISSSLLLPPKYVHDESLLSPPSPSAARCVWAAVHAELRRFLSVSFSLRLTKAALASAWWQ